MDTISAPIEVVFRRVIPAGAVVALAFIGPLFLDVVVFHFLGSHNPYFLNRSIAFVALEILSSFALSRSAMYA